MFSPKDIKDRNELRLSFQKGDFICIAAVSMLAICLALHLAINAKAAEKTMVQIYHEGILIKECSLEEDLSFSVDGEYTNNIVIKDGKVSIVSSTCPGADCVHSGWIEDAGRAIICLPNKTEVRIVGVSDVDMVAG